MFSREINIVKREQKMTETFGHSNIFATLSLSLSCANRQSTSFHTCAYVRQYTAFFAEMQGKPCYFLSLY